MAAGDLLCPPDGRLHRLLLRDSRRRGAITAAASGRGRGVCGSRSEPRKAGVPLWPPQPPDAAPAPAATPKLIDPLPRVLMALAAVILTGRVLAGLLEYVGQPPVIGEVLAGIALGPSLLGWISRDWFGLTTSPLMPPEIAPYLSVIAQLGVILYMFLIGLEFNAGLLKSHAHAAIAISHASII